MSKARPWRVGLLLLRSKLLNVLLHHPMKNPSPTILCLKNTEKGWAIARMLDDGELEQLSWPFPSMKKAQEFCAIANYDLLFIPSALPHILERFKRGG